MMPNDRNRPRSPRPYNFVPFAKIKLDFTVGHEQIHPGHYTGRLLYGISVLTPLFVGSGSYALGQDVGYPQERIVRDCCRMNSKPIIPGSSIKGMVRSIVEAVSHSCVTTTRLNKRLIAQNSDIRCTPEKACPTCSIFGRMNRMSKVFFGDLILISGRTRLFKLAALYAPRAHRARGAYQTDNKFKGRKFYYHALERQDSRQPPVVAIASKSRLQGQLNFENLTGPELGLVFYALGFDGSITLKLGGGKPMGLGTVHIDQAQLLTWDGSDFTQIHANPTCFKEQSLLDFIRNRMQEAVRGKFILRKQHQALQQILRYPTDRPAPSGMY